MSQSGGAHSATDSAHSAQSAGGAPGGALLGNLITAAVALLFVWRLLIPTEGAPLGDGLGVAQFSLGVLVLWAIWCWQRRSFEARFAKIDVAVGMLIGGHLISGAIAFHQGSDQRATINMLCEWTGLGATFFLLRQIVRTENVRRQFVVMTLSVVAALAALGLWQHYVWYPTSAAHYRKIRNELDAVLEQPLSTSRAARTRRLQQELWEFGVPYEAHQGPGRIGYEARLEQSTEPLGRFALTNSFAGLLAVWLIVAFAILAHRLRASPADTNKGPVPVPAWIAGALLLMLIAYCLILTKSRTAHVATLAGMAIVIFPYVSRAAKLPRRTLCVAAACGAVAVGLVVAAAATGGLDRWVITEASKSLRYRLEYWQGTWQVIKAHPVWGVGPGNFRNHYLQHKLPESSEEIADPHNLVLDVWVNGGLIALIGLTTIGTVSAGSLIRRKRSGDFEASGRHDFLARQGHCGVSTTPPGRIIVPLPPPVLGGGFFAMAAMCLIDPTWEAAGLLAIGIAAVPVCRHAVGMVSMRPALFVAAAITLVIHLLGAGGIAMPAICQTLFLLLVLMMPDAENSPSPKKASRIACAGTLVAALGLSWGCWHFGTGPVIARTQAVAAGDFAIRQRGDLKKGQQAFMRAAAMDRFSAEPWRKLAELEFGRWLASRKDDGTGMARVNEAMQNAHKKNPRSWADYRTSGEYRLRAYGRSRRPESANAAVEALSKAVELYPNHAPLRGRLAVALAYALRPADARREALFALKLQKITARAGHSDRLLPEQTVKLLHALANEGLPPTTPSTTD